MPGNAAFKLELHAAVSRVLSVNKIADDLAFAVGAQDEKTVVDGFEVEIPVFAGLKTLAFDHRSADLRCLSGHGGLAGHKDDARSVSCPHSAREAEHQQKKVSLKMHKITK